MDYFAQLMVVLERWNHLGRRDVSNGTKLIGHVPHVGSLAYLHNIYAGLSRAQIDQIEADIGRKLPSSLRQFYIYANGCALFGGALSIGGLRFNYDRSLEDTSRQPVSIRTANIPERPKGANPQAIFFGWYNYDGSSIFFNGDESVLMCPRRAAQPILYRWDSFEQMMISEVNRLALMFDESGHRIDPSVPTIPPLSQVRGTG
jgi:hypothetical protein